MLIKSLEKNQDVKKSSMAIQICNFRTTDMTLVNHLELWSIVVLLSSFIHTFWQLFLLLLLGTRYMIVDCGGGTVDITVHEMDARTGKLKELHKATGGPYGSVGKWLTIHWMDIIKT